MPFDQSREASPFNSLPPVIILLALAMLAVEAVLSLSSAGMFGGPQGIGWRQQAFAQFSLWKPVMAQALEAGHYTPDVLWRFVTYPFINGSFTQMLFPVVILLAVGKFVGEAYSALALAATWLLSAIGAGMVFLLVQPITSQMPLAGGMAADYGLIGALTFLLWRQARWQGVAPYRAFRLIGMLIGFQLLVYAAFGGALSYVVAEVAGFAIGFGLGFVLAPGEWQRFLHRVRGR